MAAAVAASSSSSHAPARLGRFGHPYLNKPFPFDLPLATDAFPRVNDNDDSVLSQAIVARADALLPEPEERANLTALVIKVRNVLDKIQSSPDMLPGVTIEEVREVGSYKKDTMVRGSSVADLVVVTRSMPTIESVLSLGQKICSEVTGYPEALTAASRENGCQLNTRDHAVRLLISTISANTKNLEKDLHLSYDVIAANQAMIFHARWFEEYCTVPSVRLLVRVLKDLRHRYKGLVPINVWAFESLAQYAIVCSPSNTPLALGPAFRRVLALLSAGVFLPGSSGLCDPVDNRYRLCDRLSFEEMDTACNTAQTLLRLLSHGSIEQVLGTQPSTDDITTKINFCNGTVVTPLEKAYDETLFKSSPAQKSEDDEMMGK